MPQALAVGNDVGIQGHGECKPTHPTWWLGFWGRRSPWRSPGMVPPDLQQHQPSGGFIPAGFELAELC